MITQIILWLDPEIEKKPRWYRGLLGGSVAFWYFTIVQGLIRIIIG